MTGNDPTQDVLDHAWQIIADIRDNSPRHPNDASTDNIVSALHVAGLLVKELPR